MANLDLKMCHRLIQTHNTPATSKSVVLSILKIKKEKENSVARRDSPREWMAPAQAWRVRNLLLSGKKMM
jgi:hypothetical protein